MMLEHFPVDHILAELMIVPGPGPRASWIAGSPDQGPAEQEGEAAVPH